MDLANVLLMLRKYRVFVMVGLVLISVLLILVNYSVLIITVDSSNKNATLTIRENVEESTGGKKVRSGINVLQRGNYFVEAKNDDQITTAYPSVKPLRFNRLNIGLKPQNKIEKLTENQNTANCVFGNTNGVYYVCKEGAILKKSYGSLAPGARILNSLRVSGTPASYKEGILAFVNNEGGDQEQPDYLKLAYITPESLRIIDNQAAKYIDEYGGKIITKPNENFFTINNKAKKQLFLFKDERSQPATYEYQKDLEGHVKQTSLEVSLDSNKLFLAFASASEEPSNEEEHSEDLGELKLIVFDRAQSGALKKSQTLPLPNSVNSASLVRVVGDVVFAHDGVTGDLSILSLAPTKISKVTLIPNVPATSVVGESYYYIKDERLYVYSPSNTNSYLVSSSKTSIASLFSFGDKLVFTGTPFKAITKPSTYMVSDAKKPKNGNLFELLPYDANDLPIVSSDYAGNTLRFNVRLNSQVFYRDTSGSTYNQREYELKKEMILRRLKSDGLDTSLYDIQFIAGP